MKNPLKAKMLAGERTLGTFFETGSTTVALCRGLARPDYVSQGQNKDLLG